MVMPPPMVPAPITPTLRISRSGVPSGRSAILPAARSAANTWRRARDSGVAISDRNASRSSRSAFVERLAHRRGDRLHALHAAPGYGPASGADVVARELQEGLGLRILDLDVAQALERQLLGHDLLGQRHRGGDRVAVGHFVQQRRALELRGRHRGAARRSC